MKKQVLPYKVRKNSLFEKLKHQIYLLFKIIDYPVVKVYTGYGNADKILVIGHVLKLSPMPRKTYRKNWVTNFFSIIRLFITAPYANAPVLIKWGADSFNTKAEKDGFFKFEICPAVDVLPGWHPVSVHLNVEGFQQKPVFGVGKIYIPYTSQNAFISDIDDTFLISYSSRIRRRLYVLFTRNERTRKLFDGVIHHYQALAESGQQGSNSNPFFYVSSSEWNLYEYIVEFARFNNLPKGIFLLGQMKRLKDFWKSGQNNHATKLLRIVRILEQYPSLKFVLLGDDSQQDPYIYHSVVSHFPGRIKAVYLRRVHKPHHNKVKPIVEEIQKQGVECCYFEHSAEAMIHSKSIGLISKMV